MGHSQGTSITFTYLATKPEYAEEKVNMAIVCSTAVFVGNFFRKIAGKIIYNGILYTVIKLVNTLLIK